MFLGQGDAVDLPERQALAWRVALACWLFGLPLIWPWPDWKAVGSCGVYNSRLPAWSASATRFAPGARLPA